MWLMSAGRGLGTRLILGDYRTETVHCVVDVGWEEPGNEANPRGL